MPQQPTTRSFPTPQLRLALDCIVEREQLYDHIARVLHDDLGQTLLALTLHLHWISHHCADQDRISEQIAKIREIVSYTHRTLKSLAREYRPLHHNTGTSLRDLVTTLVAQFRCESRFDCRLDIRDPLPRMSPAYILAVARILHGILAGLHTKHPCGAVTIHLANHDEHLLLDIACTHGDIELPERTLTWMDALGGTCETIREDSSTTSLRIALPVLSDID